MNQLFKGWNHVTEHLTTLAEEEAIQLNEGQRASLRAIAARLPNNGVIIADEVGMGKTRIATATAKSVLAAGGRVAILVPPGLGYQWGDELRAVDIEAPLILRSLWQYLQAWEQKEKPKPWFEEHVVVISHSFTNWRLGTSSERWRWALLPELYARWRKSLTQRFPRDYHQDEKTKNACKECEKWVKNAAESIIGAIKNTSETHPSRDLIHEMVDHTPWPGALIANEYARDASLRPWLEKAVGLGLGIFDLVIIDEAHKSRGHDSGLNRLMDQVILTSSEARRLAMTATPVELEAEQWKQILGRIRVGQDLATDSITNYSEAVRKIRQSPSDSNVRDTFFSAARAFHSTLNPYLLRRDKREDPAVQKFTRHTGEEYHTYRRENEILIETNNLSTNWKRSVCAAEALSFVTRQSDATSAKRLRLTMGNGHGIAALIDELQRDQKDDLKQIESDGDSHHPLHQTNSEVVQPNKRMQRIDWWQNVMIQPFKNNEHALLDHPAILAAAVEIENVCQQGEKVLVFGRFTRPLRALVNLLNAREMLRNLDKGGWPQSKVHESEWSALVAAHRQLKLPGNLDRVSLNETLEQQYRNREQKRRDFRKTLIANIEAGIPLGRSSTHVRAIFYAFKAEAMTRTDQDLDNTEHTVSVVARAMLELMGPDAESASHTDFATAFADLIEAASERDEGDADGDGELSETEAINFWSELETRVREEYNRQEGGFARLMFGETKQATRRLLQLAFNRRHSSPKVLVAQSLVGREGLNLHKACRTVVLLHPEWNPGVVEQQIGRVDRIGSLWETMINEAISHQPSNTDLPRIEVRPVIFQGTYDEKNWQVLRERWDDLRAQLHGIVISQRIASNYDDSEIFIKEINKFAPNFSPTSS